jgi:hypothetical protein
MTMNGTIEATSPIEAPQAPEVAKPSEPELPKTPGEAAKEARISAEARARLQRVKAKSDALFKERQAFEAEKKRTAEERATSERTRAEEIATLQKELKELREGNPLLRASGEEATRHLREFVAQGTPEAQIVALQRKLEDQEKQFAARFEELKTASQKREEEEQRRIAEINKSRSDEQVRQFTLWATTGEQAKNLKHLNAEFSQEEVHQLAQRVVDWAKSHNKAYSGLEVAAYLEKHAEGVYKNREERRLLYLSNGVSDPARTPAVSAPTKASLPATGNGAPRRTTHQRAKSREEEIEEDLAVLRKATERDRLAARSTKK